MSCSFLDSWRQPKAWMRCCGFCRRSVRKSGCTRKTTTGSLFINWGGRIRRRSWISLHEECEDGFRVAAAEALGQLALQEPVWRDEIVEGLQAALQTFLERKDALRSHPDSCYNNDWATATDVVIVLTQLRIGSAMPVISEIVSAGIVDTARCGTVAEIEKQMQKTIFAILEAGTSGHCAALSPDQYGRHGCTV